MIENKDSMNNPEQTKHRKPDANKYMMLRNILNMIFMIGALVGVGIYYFSNTTLGTIVVLVSMVFKFVEYILRFIARWKEQY